MADTTVVSPSPSKRRRWPRILAGLALVFLLLLVVIYFVATSGSFFKGFILPKVSKAMDATVTVSDASISPFSQVVLRDVKVQTTGAEPLLTATEVRARYSLWDMMHGKIHVDEVAVTSPTVQIIHNADGTSNLDPFTKKPAATKETPPAAPSKPGAPSKPPELDVKKVVLSNATVRNVQNYKGGGKDVTELSNVTITLEDLKNGQTGKLTLTGAVKMDNNPPAPGTNGMLQAKMDGAFTLGLSAALKPTEIKGQAHFLVDAAGGSFSQVATLGANLTCEVSPTNIRQVALRFQKGGTDLGEVRASGPFDLDKTEGRITVQVLSIDRQVLNLAGAAQGIDFGSTTISSSNQIDIAKAGKVITTVGQLNAVKFSISRTNQTTPPLDLRCQYDVTVNQDEKSALLRALTFTGTQEQRPLLRADLAGPMTVAWGTATPTVPDSALNFSVTGFNLADWKPFLGDAVSAGTANLTLRVQSLQSGKQLVFDLASQLDGLTAKAGSNQISQVGVTLAARGQIAELKKVNLDEYRLQLTQQNQTLLSVSGSGQVDTATQGADLQLTLNTALPALIGLMPQPDVSISAGAVELKTHVVKQQQNQTVTGTLALNDFTGRYGKCQFQAFGTTLDLDVSMKDKLIEIRKAGGALRQGANAGGSFDVSGSFDTDKKSGQFALKLSDLNQNALRPFLEAALGDKKLVSVSINGSASASLGQGGDSAVKADIQLTKLVVDDPKHQIPATPLAVGFQVDAGMQKQVADVRLMQVSLTPTDRAKNQVQLQGRVDMTQTNVFSGGLKLSAESLDLTTYYDLFATKTGSNAPAPAAAAPAPAPQPAQPAMAGAAPATTSLPFRNFPIDVNIGRLYLHEIDIANWVTSLKLDGSRVALEPVQLTLNGAPVKATVKLDLGVAGYQYDLSASGDKIPLEPLANTFMPDKKGLYKGSMLLNTQIKGIGADGASLQKSLAGQFSFTFTNAVIQLVGNSKLKQFLTPVALLLGVPEMMDSPLNWVDVHTEMGAGQINFKNLTLVSPMFKLDTGGAMPISEVLTNSPFQNWPVNLYLTRTVAERVRLVAGGAPATGDFVKLPNFLKVAGTLGTPKAQIDKTALAGTLLEKLGGKVPGLNEKTGGLLQGLGGLVPGSQSTATNQAPATNKPASLNGLFDLLKKKK